MVPTYQRNWLKLMMLVINIFSVILIVHSVKPNVELVIKSSIHHNKNEDICEYIGGIKKTTKYYSNITVLMSQEPISYDINSTEIKIPTKREYLDLKDLNVSKIREFGIGFRNKVQEKEYTSENSEMLPITPVTKGNTESDSNFFNLIGFPLCYHKQRRNNLDFGYSNSR
ncbi:hypothetical protein ACTFIR_004170 [Dictyostelium discoideum]